MLIFWKTLEQLVGDGMQTKALKMTDESQQKLQDTMERLSMKVMEVLYASLFKNVDKRIEKEYTLIDKVFFDS